MIFLFPLDVVLAIVVLVVVGPLLGGVAVVVVVADVLNTAPLLCAAVNRVNSMCHNHFKSLLKRQPKMIKQRRLSDSTSTLKAAAVKVRTLFLAPLSPTQPPAFLQTHSRCFFQPTPPPPPPHPGRSWTNFLFNLYAESLKFSSWIVPSVIVHCYSHLRSEICTQVHSLRRHEPTCSKFEQAI